MLEKGDILKWNLEGPILKKVKLLRDRVLNKNEDAVGIPDGDLHITLAAGPNWSKVKREANSEDKCEAKSEDKSEAQGEALSEDNSEAKSEAKSEGKREAKQ